MGLRDWMDRRFYPEFDSNWDDSLFRDQILRVLRKDSVVLDLGAGRGVLDQMNFRGQCEFIAGVDPDDAVLINENLDEAKVLRPPSYAIPYPDETFDVVFSNNVLEHISQPLEYFGEVARVLKPGGHFLAKTPNRNHYVALIARFTPHWFHELVNKIRGRERCDTFPTVYASNSRRDISIAANGEGLSVTDLQIVEGRPEYLRTNPATYACGLAYERFVNRFRACERFRCVIMLQLEKTQTAPTSDNDETRIEVSTAL